MKTNTKQKISASLKRHYSREKRIDRIKTFAVWLTIITIAILIQKAFFIAPHTAEAYFTHHYGFPVAEDQEMMVDVETQIRLIANRLCKDKGLEDYCIEDLTAIAFVESRFNCKAIGDGGMSRGCLQIHLGYHPDISVEQAEDPEFALNWTLNRMIHYNYPEYRSYAVMKHNGTPNTPATLYYLSKVNNYIN